MSAIATIHVRGAGAQAWLAACVMARFCAPDPRGVSLEVTEAPARQWVLRRGMERLHGALGLSGLGREVTSWRAGTCELPERVRIVDEVEYARALEGVARGAGVHAGKKDAELIVELSEPGAVVDGNVVRLGAAVEVMASEAALGMERLRTQLMGLVGAFPGSGMKAVEMREVERRVSDVMPPLRGMDALLSGGDAEGLAHRKAVYASVGRVVPVDHDPFTREEWVAALEAAGVTRQGVGRMEFVRG